MNLQSPTPAPHQMGDAVNSASYVLHMMRDKPMVVALSAALAPLMGKIGMAMPDIFMSLGALFFLVMIDWITKIRACRNQGVPVTSEVMRQRGFYKLRDYLILYIAGGLTMPLLGDAWGYRTVLFVMGIWELWSIAENLHDAGHIPFDLRQVAIFDGVRAMIGGGTMHVPGAPTTQTYGTNPVQTSSPTANTRPEKTQGPAAPGGNLPI